MNPKTIDTIETCAHGSQDGSLNFPTIVGLLLEAGVTHYQVDFLRAESTYYVQAGESHVVPLPLPDTIIEQEFSSSQVAAAVLASQRDGQTFPEFLVRALAAGCIGYTAYLDGQRVVYCGRLGDMHVEHFPGSPFAVSIN